MTQIIKTLVRELIGAVRASGKTIHVETVHAPEQGLLLRQYWRVTVELVQMDQSYNEDDIVLCDAGMEAMTV
jgi:hypothetical protein